MPVNYFSVFPFLSYANTQARDVTRRAVVAISARNDPRTRVPLELRAGTRADTVANRYYGSPGYTWLVLAATNTMDPYWGWYLDDDLLARLAASRWGSLEEAERRKRFYATNWASDAEREITPAGWAALTEGTQKYWEPKLGLAGQVVAYRRRREDWYSTTNMALDLTVTGMSGAFIPEERATLTSGVQVANVDVTWSNTTHVYVQHIEGNTSIVGSTLAGVNSGATATLSNTSTLVVNIPADEQVYWSPVTEWEWMVIENENKRNIRLVEARYQDEAQLELKKLLNDV